MTQKEKIIQALMFASLVKSIANRLKFDAHDYGVQFPLDIADDLINAADRLIKQL